MIEINIGMPREKAIEVLAGALDAAKLTEGTFEYTIYADYNGPPEEVTIQISNDDMEREEVAGRIFVEVERSQ